MKKFGMAGLVLAAMLFSHPLMYLHAAQPNGDSVSQETHSNLAPLKEQKAAEGHPIGSPESDAHPYTFWRLVGVLVTGLVISAARLGRKFRRFWGLGVFANPYAVPFVIFGMGVCGVSSTLGPALGANLKSMGPWIADLSGIAAWLVLPVIRFKPKESSDGKDKVRDLAGDSSANPVIAIVEDGIRDHILERMQFEISAAARRYSWDTIKVAARRSIEGETTIGRLSREDGDAAREKIDSFRPDADVRHDSDNKYEALQFMLRCSSFKRLRRSLDLAAIETQA